MTYAELLADNQRLQKRIIELEQENARLKGLGEPLLPESKSPTLESHKSLTEEEKEIELRRRVNLFRSLFRGREDVYAQRFVTKDGKRGYQPVCRNRWSIECKAHKYKCEGCAHRDLVPLDDAVIRRHLHKGAKETDIIGLFPIMEDNTCFFLCADFDDKNCQHGYKDDVLSYVGVCNDWNIPVYIERSRSGNGAHLWIFFSEPVSAALARKLGFAILGSAMERNVQLDMKSYDRFFPNQDFVPNGGFGNLVALPLQGDAKHKGNSLFVDENFEVYKSQWAFLSSVRKISGHEVSALLAQHNSRLELSSSSDTKPWETPQPDKISFEDFNGPIKLVRANGIYVPLKSVSAKVIRYLKGLASFKNRKYYDLMKARKPIYKTPSLISCYEMIGDYLCLPRGCEDSVIDLIRGNFSAWDEEDKTNPGRKIGVEFVGQLRPEQEDAVQKMLAENNGVLAATTAFGKTVAAIGMIARRKVNTLILVHSRALLEQWKNACEHFLAINEPEPEMRKTHRRKKSNSPIGILDGSQNNLHGIIDIAVFNSALTDTGVKPFVRDYGMVIADECHHTAALGYERVLKFVNAKYVYGLSASPTRQDGMTPIVFMQCGPIRYQFNAKIQMARQSFTRVLIPRFTAYRALEEKPVLQHLGDLAKDRARNEMIVNDIVNELKQGRTPIILTKLKEHICLLADMLKPHCKNIIVLMGTVSVKERRLAMERLESIHPDEPMVIVATGKFVGEGFNYPRLDTLFIALPVSYPNIVQQYTGRLHRDYQGKTEVRVYDYIDIHVPTLANMYGRRLKCYAPIGYAQQVDDALTSNPQDIVYGPSDYLPDLVSDIENAKSSVVLSCNTLQYMKAPLAKALQSLGSRGIDCIITIHKNSARDNDFIQSGIKVVLRSTRHIRAAIIDRSILWFGSIELAGNLQQKEDSVMRAFMPEVASEMLGYLIDDE